MYIVRERDDITYVHYINISSRENIRIKSKTI